MIRKAKAMVGWKEWCSLPGLSLPVIGAKIDTGARTSALHAYDIETIVRDNIFFVRFKVHPLEKKKSLVVNCEAPLIERRTVISSNGVREKRPVIMAEIRMGGHAFNAELTLTARHEMNFRMLLGRKALRAGRFNVNPAKSFLLGKVKNPERMYKQSSLRGA